MENFPLVSYCVKCYNQERYIGEALRAAFVQTYSPLEILICDDASTDRSDEIIRTLIQEYQMSGGRHKVRYFRNERNLVNLGNWQHMCELAEGELLVKADGDDFSAPERTQELVDVWMKSGKINNEVISDGTAISKVGQKLWYIKWNVSLGLGGLAAFTKRCFEEFPPLIDGVSHEGADDVVYVNRGEMLGGVIDYVPKSLVFYRQGSGETSSGINYVKMMTRGFRFMCASARQLLADLEFRKEKLSKVDYDRFRGRFEWMEKHHRALLELWLGESYGRRKAAFLLLMELKTYNPILGRFLLLPRWITASTLNTLYWLRCKVKFFKIRS